MTTTTVSTRTARRVPAWAVVAGAPLAALVVWALASLTDVSLEAGDPPTTIGPAAVVIVALATALAAWGVRSLLFRRHRTGWFVTCGVILLLSLLGPLGATSPAATLWLALRHATVAAVVVLGLAPARKP